MYIGPTDFKEGTWIGVELDTADGKHDGTVNGTRYFECRPGHGLFVRPEAVRLALKMTATQSMAVDLTDDVRTDSNCHPTHLTYPPPLACTPPPPASTLTVRQSVLYPLLGSKTRNTPDALPSCCRRRWL